MKKLFRISITGIHHNYGKPKLENLYVIEDNKQKAEAYVKQQLKPNYVIRQIYYLGYELSGIMFKGGI
jgi:hypothetical protein